MSRRGWQHLQCLYENSYKNMCKKIHHFPQIHKSTSFHDDNSTQTSIRQSSKRKKKSIWKLLFCACFHRHLCTHCVCMHDMNSLWIYDFHKFFPPFLLNNTAIMLTFLRALNAIISQICARARIFQIFMENGARAAVKIFCMCIMSKDITRIRKWKPRGRSLSRAYILSFLSRGSF